MSARVWGDRGSALQVMRLEKQDTGYRPLKCNQRKARAADSSIGSAVAIKRTPLFCLCGSVALGEEAKRWEGVFPLAFSSSNLPAPSKIDGSVRCERTVPFSLMLKSISPSPVLILKSARRRLSATPDLVAQRQRSATACNNDVQSQNLNAAIDLLMFKSRVQLLFLKPSVHQFSPIWTQASAPCGCSISLSCAAILTEENNSTAAGDRQRLEGGSPLCGS